MKANMDTAAECIRQVTHLKRKVNSHDPRIINARDAITSALNSNNQCTCTEIVILIPYCKQFFC